MTRLATNSRSVQRPVKRITAAWQMLVFPRPIDTNAAQGRSRSLRLRIDAAEDALSAPHYLLSWTETVGWHAGTSAEPAFAESSHDKPAYNTQVQDKPVYEGAAIAGVETKALRRSLTELLAEAAHDIRAPLATAQQILNDVGGRASVGQPVSREDLKLLEAASSRLSQANRWTEAILVERNLHQRRHAGVRQRFYPHQWRNSVLPLLQDLAEKHSVQLNWIGWDRSLPKLYLDPSRLSRIVMNLVSNAMEASEAGSEIAIRVAWQRNVTPSLIMTIEDTGIGLDQPVMQEINSTDRMAEGINIESLRGVGLGLRTAKLLATSMGASLTAQLGTTSGSLLRLRLPVDNPRLLVSNWLLSHPLAQPGTNTVAGLEANIVTMHSIATSKIDAAVAHQHLQQVADSDDFVYRVAAERWLWLTLSPEHDTSSSMPSNLQTATHRLTRVGRQTSSAASCQAELVYRHYCPAKSEIQIEALRRLANDLCEQIEIQLGGKVPQVDQLGHETESFLKPLNASPKNRVRCDSSQAIPEPQLPRTSTKGPSNHVVGIESETTVAGTERNEAATADAISDVLQQWKAIQRKLSNLQAKHNTQPLLNNAAAS